MAKTPKCIGILTSGGDCPGLNAAIRGVAKAALHHGIRVVGIQDGFRGLVENRTVALDARAVSGILTLGGTLLGTSRDKPHKMDMGGKIMDMTDVALANAQKLQLDCLVALGGNGTQKNCLRLSKQGLPVVTLPKTIDNDVWGTDISFGFDTALGIATEAIDRLHTTATSHHRIIVCEIMGHSAGWLALGSGIAGGADAILIPEIPYSIEAVAEHLEQRRRTGRRFSIIAVAEGALSEAEAAAKRAENADEDSDDPPMPALARGRKGKKKKGVEEESVWTATEEGRPLVHEPMASRIAREVQKLTGVEARVTSLGHVQRGGCPSASDRLLCTRLGTAATELIMDGKFNCMVAVQGTNIVPIPLKETAGKTKTVPTDHEWIRTAQLVETCMGR